MRLSSLAILTLFAAPAVAEDAPFTAQEFEAFTTGKVFSFASRGELPYGAEAYLPNRQVIWTYFDDQCLHGRWYPKDGNICFSYEDGTADGCWTYTPNGKGFDAFEIDSPWDKYLAWPIDYAMQCGPRVGT